MKYLFLAVFVMATFQTESVAGKRSRSNSSGGVEAYVPGTTYQDYWGNTISYQEYARQKADYNYKKSLPGSWVDKNGWVWSYPQAGSASAYTQNNYGPTSYTNNNYGATNYTTNNYGSSNGTINNYGNSNLTINNYGYGRTTVNDYGYGSRTTVNRGW